jgi:hypothetical protein
LVDEISSYWTFFWCVYVSFVIFAVIRIIGAIFLKETLHNASVDADTMIQEQLSKRKAFREKLAEAFDAIDVDGQGAISREDFQKIVTIPKVQAYLAVLDFEIHDSGKVFSMLEEDNDGTITLSEFLEGIMQLKGHARQLDVVAVQRDCKFIQQNLVSLMNAFEDVHNIKLEVTTVDHMSACTGCTNETTLHESMKEGFELTQDEHVTKSATVQRMTDMRKSAIHQKRMSEASNK